MLHRKKVRVTLHCSFPLETANVNLMTARTNALVNAGYDAKLFLQPFRTESGKLINPIKLLFGSMRPLLRMMGSRVVVIHKALPLGLFYLAMMRLLNPKAKTVLILDDWEGVGGYASTRSTSVFDRMLVTLCEEWMHRKASHCVVVSKVLEQRFIATAKYLKYIPNGGMDAHIPSEKKRIVGYVGTLKSIKLVAFLASVFNSIDKSIECVVVGGGPCLELMKSMCDREVKFTGQVHWFEAQKIMNTFLIALLPLMREYPDSIVDESRCSAKLFEYMSAGCCVVASDYGEPRHIIKHADNGYLLPNNAALWANIIESTIGRTAFFAGGIARGDFLNNYTHPKLMAEMMEWIGE